MSRKECPSWWGISTPASPIRYAHEACLEPEGLRTYGSLLFWLSYPQRAKSLWCAYYSLSIKLHHTSLPDVYNMIPQCIYFLFRSVLSAPCLLLVALPAFYCITHRHALLRLPYVFSHEFLCKSTSSMPPGNSQQSEGSGDL